MQIMFGLVFLLSRRLCEFCYILTVCVSMMFDLVKAITFSVDSSNWLGRKRKWAKHVYILFSTNYVILYNLIPEQLISRT